MNATQRIEALVAYLNTNIKALSELCGYERPQAFYDILKGKTKNVSPTMADKILAVFPEISRVWLITGSGPMMKAQVEGASGSEQGAGASCSQNQESGAPASPNQSPFPLVPLISAGAFAGPIRAFYNEGVPLANCPMVPSAAPQAELAIVVNGDSMEPEFPNGSTLYIARINERAFIPWGQPMVLDTENGVYVKSLIPDEADDNYVWAHSLNPKYPPMRIPKTSIFSLYRVLGASKFYSAV